MKLKLVALLLILVAFGCNRKVLQNSNVSEVRDTIVHDTVNVPGDSVFIELPFDCTEAINLAISGKSSTTVVYDTILRILKVENIRPNQTIATPTVQHSEIKTTTVAVPVKNPLNKYLFWWAIVATIVIALYVFIKLKK